jgi:Zn-dependent protease with chaperone function
MRTGISLKILSGILFAALLAAELPSAPAYALSTSAEIAGARRTDREVVAEQGVIANPLLDAWVNRIAASDWRFVGRKDVPYSIKILDEGDVNAFTIGGGYIYINAGALDFVTSDDELAGVIAHETGHNERRHPITLRQRGELLSILFGLAALVVPMSIGMGSFAEEGLMAHASRTDEYQADQYGLMVMANAGYDPDAMLSFMQRLGETGVGERVDAYLADHPGLPERIARLKGYRELDPKTRLPSMRLASALHDERTGRYSIAMEQFQKVVAALPKSATAWLGLGETEVAMGFPERARGSFAKALLYGSRAQHESAAAPLRALPFGRPLLSSPQAGEIDADRREVLARRAALQRASETSFAEIAADRARLASIQARLAALSIDAGDLAGSREGGQSETDVAHGLESIGRAVNATLTGAATVVGGVGSLARGRESGLLEDTSELISEIGGLLASESPPHLRAIPGMLATVAQEQQQLGRSVAEATEALLRLSRALDRFDALLRAAKNGHAESATQTERLLGPALAASNRAQDAYDRARALVLEDRITLLDVDATPAANRAFRRALAVRCGIAPPPEALVARDKLTAGEVAVATVLAASRREPAVKVIERISARPAPRGDALALEIFLGLIYLDYTDALPKPR